MDKKLPVTCPSCGDPLNVKSLSCGNCHTEVAGQFSLPLLLQLAPADLEFVLEFVKTSGSLKLMAQKLGLSYPTVRNMLDELILKIENLQNK